MQKEVKSIRLKTLIFGTALVALAAPAASHAATIPVTQTADFMVDDDQCSLREAVQSANTNAAFNGCNAGEATLDVIKLPAGNTTRGILETTGNPDDNSGGDVDVNLAGGPVEFAGLGGNQSEMRGTTSGQFRSRVIDVLGTGTVDFHDLSISNSLEQFGPGAGLRTRGADVTMTDVRVYNLEARIETPQDGGADAVIGGGAISVDGGSLSLDGGLLSGDTAWYFVDNENDGGTYGGGAILLTGGATADLNEIRFYANDVTGGQPAMEAGGGAVAAYNAGDVTIRNSTFEENDINSSSGAVVGGTGIYWKDTAGANNVLSLDNITVTEGDAQLAGAANGGIYANDGTVRAANITVAGNGEAATPRGPQVRWLAGDGSFTMRSSILASVTGTDNECAGDPITSAGYNVERGPVNNCGFAATGDSLEDPALGPLRSNGGPTQTQLPGNPTLIDRIPPASCVDSSGSAPQTHDQRGFLRTGNCDVGAVEMGCGGKSATILGTPGNDPLNGTSGDDVIVGLAGDDTINAGAGNDLICGGEGTDTINGEAGDDLIQPYLGSDITDGGPDNDTISLAEFNFGITVNLAANTATNVGSIANFENAIGGTGGANQVLIGTSGPNILDGSMAQENGRLIGGGGDDTLIGTGTNSNSRADYTDAPNGVTVNLTTGQATGEGTDTLVGVSGVNGSGFADTFVGNQYNNQFAGAAGIDVVDYSSTPVHPSGTGITGSLQTSATGPDTGLDTFSSNTIENWIGTPNDDDFSGNTAVNNLNAGAGTDTIRMASAGAIDLAAGTMVGGDTISAFENVIGSGGNDTITGDSNDNVLEGALGNDTITGGGGTDSVGFTTATGAIIANLALQTGVGQGNDTLVDIDNVVGSPFNDVITGNASDNIIDGRGGTDFVTYAPAPNGVQVDMTTGVATGHGTDTLINMEDVLGSGFGDTLLGNDDRNTIDGGDGDDTIDGRLDKDALEGGLGTDRVSFASNTESVEVDILNNEINGQGDDAVSGFENVTGSGGDDLIKGNGGNNAIDGGPGTDNVSYADSGEPVTVDLGAGTASGQGDDTLANVENARGSSNADSLAGTPTDNVLDGGPGKDTADYSAGGAITASLIANTVTGAGNDQIPAIESVIGSAAADTITGDGGANVLTGGAGGDTLVAGGGPDDVLAGPGADILRIRDSISDNANCGDDSDNDTVTADGRGIDVLAACNGSDTYEYLGEPVIPPVGETPPAVTPPVINPPAAKKCKKPKKLKKGKCVKKKKKKKKKRKK
jgi:CSLREA domain-containing protein